MGSTEKQSRNEGPSDDGQPGRTATVDMDTDMDMDDLVSSSRGVDERRLVRKLDLHLIPLIMGIYLFSFVDRHVLLSVPFAPFAPFAVPLCHGPVNLGNARLYGLEQDVGLSASQFQVAISIFFVTYMLFEVPSNLVLKRLTPRRWIAFITVSWGLVATLTGLVSSYGSLLACRLLLGAVEAGLFPGLNVYLTFFYTRNELALRVGYLFVSAAVAGALGGLLAYGIGHMDGVQGLAGWRWILIIEGIPSVALGVVTYFALPNDAETAWFLGRAERALMELRRRREYGGVDAGGGIEKRDVLRAVTDPKAWGFYVAQFGVDTMLYGFSTFLPTIIQALGTWTTAQVQLLTIPCYFLGAAVYMGTAFLSDRVQMRGLFCVVFGSVSVVGYGILLADVPTSVRYFACFLVAAGLYVVVGLPLAWLPNNSPRYGKRATSTALQLTFGNTAGVMSAFIYPKSDAPRYTRGHAVCLSMVAMGTAMYGFLWYWYWRQNRRRKAGVMDDKYRDKGEAELMALGDDSPRFRYTI
ncbi:Major facilitator superfamily domain, general substrate transporter [Metarhizium album ARSEF 1941]|uniref:Major facilitator superfamily domain, general substrate transporter n=1 Tax=Metarhizium album (strain ARSEF 1941) TaxID=1081103 RepID=A0A0B2X9U0_METAS|nr:Major facilitator superfamily domain, general substrate transporter [Metarhizium album ARSEF 1941]KHO02091.1 Major facilitator superfamily domain, general substrate transporter [Metarhizium album ARSEF 1941]